MKRILCALLLVLPGIAVAQPDSRRSSGTRASRTVAADAEPRRRARPASPAPTVTMTRPSAWGGAAARYPAGAPETGKPVDLKGRINLCRTKHQQASAMAAESDDLLALSAYVALQSRGRPIAPPDDVQLAALRAKGAEIVVGMRAGPWPYDAAEYLALESHLMERARHGDGCAGRTPLTADA